MKTLLFLYAMICSFSNSSISEWTAWKKSPCYQQIEYRYRHVRTQGDREAFEIQFKNGYEQTAYFDYALASTEQEEDIHHPRRTSIAAHRESKPTELFSNSTEFTIEVGRLSFSPYSTDYEACDSNEEE